MNLRLTGLAPILALSTVALGASLALGADWKGKEETRDGVLHVMNPAEPRNGKVTLDLEELWRLGGESEDENEFFGVIVRVANDAEGNVYLLDAQLSEVKVFDKNGQYLRTIGREGEGPGEFRRPADLFFVPGGNIGVLQLVPAKIVLLSKDGNPAGDYPTPKIEGEGFLSVSGAQLAGDQLVCMAQAGNFDQEKGTFTQTMMMRGVDSSGNIVADYFTEARLWEFSNPIIEEPVWDTIQNRWQVASDGRVIGATKFHGYSVNVWNADGKINRVIEVAHPARTRTAEEKARVQGIYEAFTRQAPNSKIQVSDTDKEIAAIFTRDDGTIWALSCHGSHSAAGSLGTFDVFDPSGHFVKQVTLRGEGNAQEDGYFFVGDRVYVVTSFLDALVAMQGGGAESEEAEEEPAPMSVICYRLDDSKLAMK